MLCNSDSFAVVYAEAPIVLRSRINRTFSLLLLLFVALPPSLRAAAAFEVSIPAVARPPSLNGDIDASWSSAARFPLAYDFTYQREAASPSTVYVANDGNAFYVAFAVVQSTPLIAVQHTNGPGVLNDDNVSVVLWPQGTHGFSYTFTANSLGARYQTSTENTSYSPQWTASVHRTTTGYTVIMRIPFNIIRTGGSTRWQAQFERTSVASNSVDVWEHATNQANAADVAFAGTLDGMTTATRSKPRVQVYVLKELTTNSYGGSTSRLGADFSLPVTPTSSLVGTLHPDYSNVEIDQQTIAPTAFARKYSEVRPFFTQAAASFNYVFNCANCPQTLYTPSIPTFREGYAYEGTAGPVTFAAFDAMGLQRSDSGETAKVVLFNAASANSTVALQRIAVDTPSLHDDATTATAGYFDHRSHIYVFTNAGMDRGSNVTDASLGNYFEYGAGYSTQNTKAFLSLQRIGSQFTPADGFVYQPGIGGYLALFDRTFKFSPSAPLQDIAFDSDFGRYGDEGGHLAQTDGYAQVNFDFRSLAAFHIYTQANGVLAADGELLPFNRNGFDLGYKLQTSTPSDVSYTEGLYYHGHLTSWSYSTTIPLRRKLNMSLELDENLYSPGQNAPEPVAKQWLQRASLDWQFTRETELDVGLRRILGRNLPNAFQTPDLPASGSLCDAVTDCFSPFELVDASNVSLALHFLSSSNEFYAAYGNPNSLATTPAFYLKWIRYIGAQKGT